MPKNFYILITLEDAFKRWRESGRVCTFKTSIQVLELFGYKIV